MCNLYTMTATVDEMRRLFGAFDGDATNLPPFDEIYPGRAAPVLRRGEAGGFAARDDAVGLSRASGGERAGR